VITVQSRVFIEKYRDLKLRSDSLPHSLRQMNTILHCRAAQWHKGHNIRGPHPRVNTIVFPDIDEISRHAKSTESRFSNGVRFTDKAEDRAVVISIHRLVQQPNPLHRLHGQHQCPHCCLISSLTEVRHTLDKSIHVLSHQE
jgi:hypothetical protein